MNLPEQFTWLVERLSPVHAVNDYKTQLKYGQSAVTVDQAWHVAEKRYPNGYLYLFSVPNSDTGVYVLNIIGPLGGGFHGRRKVLVDRYGEVLHTFDPPLRNRWQCVYAMDVAVAFRSGVGNEGQDFDIIIRYCVCGVVYYRRDPLATEAKGAQIKICQIYSYVGQPCSSIMITALSNNDGIIGGSINDPMFAVDTARPVACPVMP